MLLILNVRNKNAKGFCLFITQVIMLLAFVTAIIFKNTILIDMIEALMLFICAFIVALYLPCDAAMNKHVKTFRFLIVIVIGLWMIHKILFDVSIMVRQNKLDIPTDIKPTNHECAITCEEAEIRNYAKRTCDALYGENAFSLYCQTPTKKQSGCYVFTPIKDSPSQINHVCRPIVVDVNKNPVSVYIEN